MRLLLVPLFFVIVASTATAQPPDGPRGNPLVVQVGVFNVRADGTVGGYAVDTGEADAEPFGGGIATDGCRFGAGDSWLGAAMPAWARDAWEIRGRVDNLSPDQATIQLDWRRVRSAAAVVEQPAESKPLTLPLDQLVTLDRPAENNAQCAPNTVVFGARYTHRFPNAGTAGWRSPVRSGAGAGSGAGGGAGVGGAVRGGAAAASGAVYNAELWLVHSVPGKPETVVPATVRVAAGPAAFDFALVQVTVPGGTLVVHVNGQLHILRGTGSQPVLVFDAKRAATFTPSNRPPRDAAASDPEGRATVTRPLPGPDDVLEFEMPPMALRGVPVPPGSFAVRLRLKPVKGGF